MQAPPFHTHTNSLFLDYVINLWLAKGLVHCSQWLFVYICVCVCVCVRWRWWLSVVFLYHTYLSLFVSPQPLSTTILKNPSTLSLYLLFSSSLSLLLLFVVCLWEKERGTKIEREVVSPFLALLLDLYLSGWQSLKYRGIIYDRLLDLSEQRMFRLKQISCCLLQVLFIRFYHFLILALPFLSTLYFWIFLEKKMEREEEKK